MKILFCVYLRLKGSPLEEDMCGFGSIQIHADEIIYVERLHIVKL